MSQTASPGYSYVQAIPAHRPFRRRSKTGCLSCRLRRKKCDEQKPACKSCERQHLLCSWPSEQTSAAQQPDFAWRRKLKAGCSIAQSSPTAPNEVTSKVPPQASVQLEPGPDDNDKEPDSNPIARHLSVIPSKTSDMPLFPLLLRHYICRTANSLVGRESSYNPLLSEALSVAYSNPLVMHGLVAVSGMHLQHKNSSSEVQLATYKYYGTVLRELKYSLTNWVAGSRGEPLHLLLLSIMMCLYEALSGSVNGTLIQHIRASREFALYVFANRSADQSCDLAGVLVEGYVYFALIAQFASFSAQESNDDIPLLTTLKHLRTYNTCGVYLGCAHQLYELIPAVTEFVLRKKRASFSQSDEHAQEQYESLRRQVAAWSPESNDNVATARKVPGSSSEHVAGLIIQDVLLILLHECRMVRGESLADMMKDIQPLVDDAMSLFELISDAPASNVIGWAMLILGSVMQREDQKRSLSQILRNHHAETAYSSRVADILEWVWSDPDERTFGMTGLEKVAREHRIHLCLA